VTRRPRTILLLGIAAVACVALTIFWLGSGAEVVRDLRARKKYPRIVLVTLDTLNVWYTSLYSPDGAPTPNLEALARSGVLFQQARTVVPMTLPSHTSLLSGRMPWDTKVMINGDHVPDAVRTLPEILRDAGYTTAAFLSLGVLNPIFNLDQGFDEYSPVPIQKVGRWYRTADEVSSAALGWMEDHADEPFFVWIHISDPHAPYGTKEEPPDTELLLDDTVLGRYSLDREERHHLKFELPPGKHRLVWRSLDQPTSPRPPVTVLELLGAFELRLWSTDDLPQGPIERKLLPSWGVNLSNPQSEAAPIEMTFSGHATGASTAWARGRYRSEITYADRYLGNVRSWFKNRGLEDGTLWLIASDHGEGLGHGGTYGHAAFNHEEQLRTLLLFSGPDLPQDVRLGSPPVLLVDALPTILDLLGLPVPDAVEGKSLVDCWSPQGCRPPRREWLAYGANRRPRVVSASLFRWPIKALWSRKGAPGFFDLAQDPRENEPLQSLPRTLERLRLRPRAVPGEQATMVDALVHQVDALSALVDAAGDRPLDEEQKEMLRSLGYL